MGFHLISPFTEEKNIFVQIYLYTVSSDLLFKPHKTEGNHACICHAAAVLEFLLKLCLSVWSQ